MQKAIENLIIVFLVVAALSAGALVAEIERAVNNGRDNDVFDVAIVKIERLTRNLPGVSNDFSIY